MKTRRKTTINHTSNAELLHEINKSKIAFSSFIDENYQDFSMIIEDESDLTPEVIQQAKVNKAIQLNRQLLRKLVKDKTPKPKIEKIIDEQSLKPEDISLDQLTFRIMTYDHVPDEYNTGKKNMLNNLKFPPFKHYAYVDGKLTEVGRSHWQGGLHNGHFNVEHGIVSNDLSKALIKMVDRYGSKANFSGYSYLEEMKGQALLQLSTVAIQFDESKSNMHAHKIHTGNPPNPFSWYTTTIHTSFLKILKSEKKQREIRDEIMQQEAGMSSYAYQDKDDE